MPLHRTGRRTRRASQARIPLPNASRRRTERSRRRRPSTGARTSPPSAEAMAGVADAALELARKRHRAAGFDPETRPPATDPLPRGARLVAEIAERLRAPFQSESERRLAQACRAPAARDRGARSRSLEGRPGRAHRARPGDKPHPRCSCGGRCPTRRRPASARPSSSLSPSGARSPSSTSPVPTIVPSASGNPDLGHDPDDGLTIASGRSCCSLPST